MRPLLRSLPPKLPWFAIIALAICTPCTGQPMAGATKPRTSPARGAPRPVAKMNASRSHSLQLPGGRPDPRYRQPLNFAELQAVAGEVATATGRKINWHLKLGQNPGPLAIIRGGIDECTIYIHPIAARKLPPNTWAFIFGHEFAHQVANVGAHSQTNPANELKADIAGARYAMAGGYRLEAFLGWVLTEPDQDSNSHGSLKKRVRSIAAHFGIPQNVIQAQTKRYSTYRSPH